MASLTFRDGRFIAVVPTEAGGTAEVIVDASTPAEAEAMFAAAGGGCEWEWDRAAGCAAHGAGQDPGGELDMTAPCRPVSPDRQTPSHLADRAALKPAEPGVLTC